MNFIIGFLPLFIIIVYTFIIVLILLRKEEVVENLELDENRWIEKYFDKVVVITLPDRKNNVKTVMKNLKIKPTIFKAIKKDNLDLEKLKNNGVITKDCNLNKGRIACHLSHLSVIREFLNDPNSDRILIFEDDLLDNKGDNLLSVQNTIKNLMNNIPSDWDFIYFGKCWDLCDKAIKINDYVNKSYPLCRHAYGVSKEGASKLIKYSLPILNKPGDEHIRDLSKKGKLNIYTPTNNIFEQNRDKFGSNLGNHNKLMLCSRNPSLVPEKKIEPLAKNDEGVI